MDPPTAPQSKASITTQSHTISGQVSVNASSLIEQYGNKSTKSNSLVENMEENDDEF